MERGNAEVDDVGFEPTTSRMQSGRFPVGHHFHAVLRALYH